MHIFFLSILFVASLAAGLLLVSFDDVVVLHVQVAGRVLLGDAAAVVQEAESVGLKGAWGCCQIAERGNAQEQSRISRT